MFASLIPLLADFIDASPAIITAIEDLIRQKKQQYASVLASVKAETADNVAALKATQAK